MHRYQPRIHLVKWREHGGSILDLDSEEYRTYIFPESVFTAVTAYQNQLVSIIPYFFIPILPVFFLINLGWWWWGDWEGEAKGGGRNACVKKMRTTRVTFFFSLKVLFNICVCVCNQRLKIDIWHLKNRYSRFLSR